MSQILYAGLDMGLRLVTHVLGSGREHAGAETSELVSKVSVATKWELVMHSSAGILSSNAATPTSLISTLLKIYKIELYL
jgi:hypothetical protein